MTYGWAILIIAVVLGALFQLGVFNSTNFAPRATPGSCRVFRSPVAANLEGICSGELPQYVAQFNGVNNKVSIPNKPSVQLNGAFTLSFWLLVNSVSGTTYDGSFSQGNAGPSGTGWIVYYANPSGLMSAGPGYKRANVEHSWLSGPILNQWKYYAVTYDGSSNLYFYANGQQTNHYSETLPTDSDISPLLLGQGDAYGSQLLSNVQIYNTSFSASDIQALYIEGIGGAPPFLRNIVGWWPLNGNTNDSSGNNNNGAPTNIVYTTSWINRYVPP